MRLLSRYFDPFARNPQLIIVCAMSVFVMSGVGLVAPILSVYANTFSASATLAGMIITLFGVGRLIINLPAGLMSQWCGKRALLIAGTIILVIGAIGAALAQTLTMLVVSRFVQGIGSGIYMTIAQAMMAQIAAPEERGRTMALYQSAILIGTGIGPMVGGMLAGHFGLSAPFWAYAVVCTGAAILAFFLVEPKDVAMENAGQPGERQRKAGVNRKLFMDRTFFFIGLVSFGIFFTRTASQWTLVPLIAATRYDMNIGMIGLLLTVQSLSNFLVLPITGSMVDRFGARPLTIISALIIAASLLMVGFGPSPAWLWAGMVILGIGGGINAPSIVSYAADIAPSQSYGPAMGLLRTWGDAGFVTGPIVVGTLADAGGIGPHGGIVANSLLMTVAGIALLMIGRSASPINEPVIRKPIEETSYARKRA
ncbi:MFS transporter [uncultured Martelella sp.]|uniref:MFS transporter n=1 Tax=uncultured Martelella sp. TaxID=392331 RepID=UPI0029C97BA2|nr:MFS transporter [uncultured Martelella sp.]